MQRFLKRLLLALIFPLIAALAPSLCAAAIYRLPLTIDESPLGRVNKGLEILPVTYRVLNSSGGDLMVATALEFEKINGKLQRSASYSIHYLQDALNMRRAEASSCEKTLHQLQGEAFFDVINGSDASTKISTQALKEMMSRDYISKDQFASYAAQSTLHEPDTHIYLESLSWLTSKQALDIFADGIPWDRISEVDVEGPRLSPDQIKALAEKGDPSIRLRVRRATIRITPGERFPNSRVDLPFVQELRASGRDEDIPQMPQGLTFEMGRASQITGLADEARELSAFAGLIIAYHIQIFEQYTFDSLRPEMRDRMTQSWINSPEHRIYLHALKPTHVFLYERAFGAKPVPKLDRPNDTVLSVSVAEFLVRTRDQGFMSAGEIGARVDLQASGLRALSIRLDGFDVTTRGPIVIKSSSHDFKRSLEQRMVGYHPSEATKKLVAELATHDTLNLTEPKLLGFDRALAQLPKNWESQADAAVTGLDSNLAGTSPDYLKHLATLIYRRQMLDLKTPKVFAWIYVSRHHAVATQAEKLGLKVERYVGSDGGTRFSFVIQRSQIEAWLNADPILKADNNKDSYAIGHWQRLYSFVNLEALF